MTQAERDYEEFTRKFNLFIKMTASRSYEKYPNKLKELSELRKIPEETLRDAGIFYVGDSVELLHPSFQNMLTDFGFVSPTNNMIIYHERWVFTIKDIRGNIISHVGYSPDQGERYVYGLAKFYDRRHDLYGLENYTYALEQGWAIVTEGITDCLAYRGLGYKNSFAMCGVFKSMQKEKLMNRLKYGIIKVPDNDRAGQATIARWQFNRSFLIITPTGFKDTAQVLENEDWRNHYKNCIPLIVDEMKSMYRNRRVYKDYEVRL